MNFDLFPWSIPSWGDMSVLDPKTREFIALGWPLRGVWQHFNVIFEINTISFYYNLAMIKIPFENKDH